jgi:hypothetical protein
MKGILELPKTDAKRLRTTHAISLSLFGLPEIGYLNPCGRLARKLFKARETESHHGQSRWTRPFGGFILEREIAVWMQNDVRIRSIEYGNSFEFALFPKPILRSGSTVALFRQGDQRHQIQAPVGDVSAGRVLSSKSLTLPPVGLVQCAKP